MRGMFTCGVMDVMMKNRITFDANGGTGDMEPVALEYGDERNLPRCDFLRPGYSFAGWATSATGAAVYDDGAVVKDLKDDIDLYAVWQAHSYTVAFDLWNGSAWTTAVSENRGHFYAMQPGVDLAASPARPLLYAEEIVASGSSPATLLNPSGALSLRVPLRYNFSAGEIRHVRIECGAGMRFLAGSSVNYAGGGSASVGAINGLGTGAISFSLTANGSAVRATDTLTVTGNRAITGTSAPVDCTYSLYDQPSQAQTGGTVGRVVSVSGRYIDFGPSTVFESSPRASTVDVVTQPAFTRFLMSGWTSVTTAGLARLTYGLASPVPLTPAGSPITLPMLHATGSNGTRIVVEGDFGATANQNGSFTGDALSRIYLSTSSANCSTVGLPASTLSASRATFDVGATSHDRMLCLRPRAGVAIPASEYTARLEPVSAQPLLYRPTPIGPLPAGTIAFDGVTLQAPLVQVLDGWYTRIALTNTGDIRRSYTLRVLSETGVTLDTVDGTGTIPGRGTKVIDLAKVLRGSTANLRGTVVVTVAGSSSQIQGLYQIVNPESGAISNHVMVRPGLN